MTTTRWATSATTPKSWVMNSTPVPWRSCSSRIRRRICACVVTSSAVVGSSAIRSAGSSTSAAAIMMRWRWPPESWWGYTSIRRSGSGRCTRRMICSTRWRRSGSESWVWISSTSAIWSPTFMTGFSAVMGSWKIMAMRVPRRSRRRDGVAFSTSSPCSRASPALALSSRGRRPITACAVTDLPEPDSPTTHTISPAPTENVMFSMACARSEPRGSCTVRPLRSRTGAAASAMCLTRAWRNGDRACRAAHRPAC